MAQELELLLAQAQTLHGAANALKKSQVLDGELLDQTEAQLQCLEGVQGRFTSRYAAFQLTLKTREQTNSAQEIANSFWQITSDAECKYRTWIQKIKRHMCEGKSAESNQDFMLTAAFQELMKGQKESMKEVLDSHKKDVEVLAGAIQKQSSGHSNVKLPKLKIPTFSGKYTDWQSFHDIFVSMVHSNKDLDDIQKFTHLKDALTGDAASALKHLPVATSNYNDAWEIVQKRFNKPDSIVSEFVNTFYAQTPISQPNSVKLRQLFNVYEEVTHGLEAMHKLQHDPFMIHSALKCVDAETRTLWFREVTEKKKTDWSHFREFLGQRCDSLEMGSTSATGQVHAHDVQSSRQSSGKPRAALVSTTQTSQSPLVCEFCSESHRTYQCPQFQSARPGERRHMVFAHKLCYNCLRGAHMLKDCMSGGCRVCNLKHNTMLHDAYLQDPTHEETNTNDNTTGNTPGNREDITQSTPKPQTKVTVGMTSIHPVRSHQVLLPTVQVLVIDAWGRQHKGRALLDSCSQPNCITRHFARGLGLPMTMSEQSISGLGLSATESSQMVTVSINSHYKPFTLDLDCLVLERITDNQPSMPVSKVVQIPPNLHLADPEFHKPGRIDMLFGADAFMKVLRTHHISGNPSFLETAFGYIIAGECPSYTQSTLQSHLATCLCATQSQDNLQAQLEKFWLVEEVGGGQQVLSPEEQLCEDHFKFHTTRNNEGRFVVKLPTRDNVHLLGSSREIAEKRFRCVERRLQKDVKLREQYQEFIRQYESLGHMRRMPDDYTSSQPAVYLSHHPVIKDSTSTPVRVVFDASAKTNSGESLNSVLMIGGRTQDDIFDILLRYRQHNIVLRADIEKMYRQILVHEGDQTMLRILWRDSPQKPLQTYLLMTVTYGTSCAPFLATRCLKQLAADERESFPQAAEATERDFYVDDVLTGASTIEEAKELQRQLDLMLKRGGFNLKKWTSNSREVLQQIPEADQEHNSSINLDLDGSVKTLGLFHNPNTDLIRFSISDITSPVSKRGMLSDTARVYDPLGILSPITVSAKILLQSLWRLKIDWDTLITGEVAQRWKEYQDNVRLAVSMVTIPRQVTCSGTSQATTLFLFCDASERAYGACIYVRTIDSTNAVSTRLLCAKTKVAPLKNQLTLPRLELCAAQLGARLVRRVMAALTISITSIHAFTDSMIVLHWIHGEPRQWKTFVGNRVATIQSIIVPAQWHHVKSQENPADMASRGVSAETLISNTMWWHGPYWMQDTSIQFHDLQFEPTDNTDLEQRNRVSLVLVEEEFWSSFIARFSSFTKLVRCIAVWRRFMQVLKQRLSKQSVQPGQLTVLEINSAKITLLRHVQQRTFPNEYYQLSSKRNLTGKTRLRNLHPFMGGDKLIRVGGRLSKADIPYNQKHPILLPRDHHVTKLISSEIHRDTLHGGAQLTLAHLRQQYWPIRGIDVAKETIRQCVTCFRAQPVTGEQMMSDCHVSRVNAAFPFFHTGVDFCGPFLIKPLIRSASRIKVYAALFICLATRAVHVELVTALTTDAFIASLRRFIARRGRPAQIRSDNATNFVGANRELKELQQLLTSSRHQSQTQDFAANLGIDFIFIPPRSPHFGGSWEAAIKRIKHHLVRTMGNSCFTEEQMMTVLTQIEACINSRPLTPLSTDPSDLQVLTPAHFLIGRPLSAAPDQSFLDCPENRLKKWAWVQQRMQSFWERWRVEYLHTLQQRQKWTKEHPSLVIGDMVIVKEDNIPPMKWMLGRITQVHPGEDGKVRVATVLTPTGTYKRAVAKLCLLPIESEIQKSSFLPGQYGSAEVPSVGF